MLDLYASHNQKEAFIRAYLNKRENTVLVNMHYGIKTKQYLYTIKCNDRVVTLYENYFTGKTYTELNQLLDDMFNI